MIEPYYLIRLQGRLDASEGGDERDHHVEAGVSDVRKKSSAAVVDSDVAFLDFVQGLENRSK